MLILILGSLISMTLMVVGDTLEKFHRERLGLRIGLVGFGLCCLIVVGVAVFILI